MVNFTEVVINGLNRVDLQQAVNQTSFEERVKVITFRAFASKALLEVVTSTGMVAEVASINL